MAKAMNTGREGFILETTVKKKKTGLIIGLIAAVVILAAAAYVVIAVVMPAKAYSKAEDLLDAGDYEDAIAAFAELGDYKDSAEQILACKYAWAEDLADDEDYEAAIELFEELDDYKKSEKKLQDCQYAMAEAMVEEEDYAGAASLFRQLEGYKDAAERALEASYSNGKQLLFVHSEYSQAEEVFAELDGYEASEDYLTLIEGMQAEEAEDYAAAYEIYTAIETDDPEVSAAAADHAEHSQTMVLGDYAPLAGTYIQHGNFDDYELIIDFTVQDGEVHPTVVYTNYMGDLEDDAVISPCSNYAGYAWLIEVSGDWQKGHYFHIYINAEGTQAEVNWATSQYTCYKEN